MVKSKEKVIFSWSGGKDSALALYEFMKQGDCDITLLSTITEKYERLSMHGVREVLIDRQAESIGCRLEKVYITPGCTNEEYQKKMSDVMDRFKNEGVSKVVFGDIFLEDVRRYREDNLSKIGMEAVFPLWGRKTSEIADTFIRLGFKTIITCVDTQVLSGDFAGRIYDRSLLAELPTGIDPCGENGEFHSFVFDGPIFRKPVEFTVGEKVLRDERFFFCDLIPKDRP